MYSRWVDGGIFVADCNVPNRLSVKRLSLLDSLTRLIISCQWYSIFSASSLVVGLFTVLPILWDANALIDWLLCEAAN